jgi:LysM repeat protein
MCIPLTPSEELRKKMSEKDSAQNVIQSYRKRQNMAQKAPMIFGLAALLLIVGAGVLIFWLTNPEVPGVALFATETPTPTETSTETPTTTPTLTPTVTETPEPTETPTPSLTPTASGPWVYTVEETDFGLSTIAVKFNTDIPTLLALNPTIDPATLVIYVGQEIIIPAPDTKLPTGTPIPQGFRGIIEHRVESGETLGELADRYLSTIDAILKENNLENQNVIPEGTILKIPVNLVTPVPTRTPGLATDLPQVPTSTATYTETPTQ